MTKKILTNVHEIMRLKHYSLKTEKSYVYWMKKFYYYHQQQDVYNLSDEHIKNFLTYLMVKEKVAPSTQNQALNALLFLYREILNKKVDFSDFIRAKRKFHIPVVLSKREIDLIFSHLSGTHLLICQILYGPGLRLTEALSIRIKDIDFDYSQIFIHNGKGDKDRRTILPQQLIKPIKEQIQKIELIQKKI